MKKKRKDGIIFDNTVYLEEENKKKFPFYMRLIQLLAVLGGSCFFIDFLIRCFSLKILYIWLYFSILITGCIFFVFFIHPAYDLIKMIISLVIYGGLFRYFFKNIRNGFYLLENAVIKRASEYYEFEAFKFVVDISNAKKDLTLVIIFFLVPVTGILAYSLLRGRLNRMIYVLMLFPVAVSFAMGITPPEIQLIGYILVFLFMSVSNGLLQVADYSHNKSSRFQQSMIRRIGIKSAMIICLLSLSLFFTLKLIIPARHYENFNRSKIYEAKSRIQNKIMNFSIQDVSEKIADVKWNIGSGKITSSGGLNFGDLGKVDQVVYDNTEHLLIKVPLSSVTEGIYLKGYVGSVYTGDSWEPHTREIADRYKEIIGDMSREEYDPVIGNAIILSYYPYRHFVQKGRYTVIYLKADKRLIYVPYFSIFYEKDKVGYEYDLSVKNDENIKIGTYDYYYNLTTGFNEFLYRSFYETLREGLKSDDQLAEYKKNEEKYRAFVYDIYTRLPEKGLERLKNDFSREALGRRAENLADAISYIKEYLFNNTRYTLAPGKLPKDKDFVEYFLYENKLGYCTHYASAGALMLRAMGYPARYVEGYAINSSDLMNSSSIYLDEIDGEDSSVEITVRDNNAHAWAEVYLDGFGWIPVDFTVGSGMDDMSDIIADINGTEQSRDDVLPTPVPTKAMASPSPEPTKIPDNMNITVAPEPGENKAVKKDGINGKKAEKNSSGTIWYGLAILILTAALCSYIFKRNFGKKNENFSKKALRIYENIERLFIIGGLLPNKAKSLEDNEEYVKMNFSLLPVKDFEECMDIAKKARFGKDEIGFMEYLIIEEFYNNLYKQLYTSSSAIKRVILKARFLIKN